MEFRNAKITGTTLGYEEHGIFTCFLYLDYGEMSQGFGGYVLESTQSENEKTLEADYGIKFITSILKTVGVDSWEKLVGEHIRVQLDQNKIYRIGNILEEKWFNPSDLILKGKEDRQE